MWFVYILYSRSGNKTYVGYTGDVERRLFEHNVSEMSGFTIRYRPWELMRKETFESKSEAMAREKYLKTGRGREEIKGYVRDFLNGNDAVSAVAEKD
ncbi:MAG TPA: GIY-YIG nuclease family protein [Chitinophagaceae bacterium]